MTGECGGTDPFLLAAQPPGSLPFPAPELPPLPAKWSAPPATAAIDGVWRDFDQTKIRCTMAVCGQGLHCFKLSRRLAKVLGPGTCRACHQPLVSLDRTAQRNLADIDHTFAALQTEAIRHYFWHVPFGQKALGYARRAGRTALHERVTTRILKRIGAAEPFRDGAQTPISQDKADALDYAPHAVAACCRACTNYWHGIPKNRPLTEAEMTYLVVLARRYLDARLPDLPDKGEPVHRRRRSDATEDENNVHHLGTSPAPAVRGRRAS